jgi:hypothetical protein
MYQGTQPSGKTGKTGKMMKKISLQGKIREFVKKENIREKSGNLIRETKFEKLRNWYPDGSRTHQIAFITKIKNSGSSFSPDPPLRVIYLDTMREVGISRANINANLKHCAILCCCLACYGQIYGFHILGKIANLNTYFALRIQCTKHGHVVHNGGDGTPIRKCWRSQVLCCTCILIRENIL